MFVGWEGVGLCSYLLIHYFEIPLLPLQKKPSYLTGLVILGTLCGLAYFLTFGSIDFNTVNSEAAARLENGGILVTIITMLLFLGATANQLKFHFCLATGRNGRTNTRFCAYTCCYNGNCRIIYGYQIKSLICTCTTNHEHNCCIGALTALLSATCF